METVIADALIASEEGLRRGYIRISGSTIAEIGLGPTPPIGDARIIEASGLIAAAGFIDLHCHGGSGADVNDEAPDAIETLAAFHRAHGVTSYLPSVAVDEPAVVDRSLDRVRKALISSKPGTPEILGAHLEGPYISPRYSGCQNPRLIRGLDEAAVAELEARAGSIARVTIAPELPGAMRAIERLSSAGIVVSIGHSEADAETCRAAVDRGATMATHLFNAMSSVRKEGFRRIPGVVEAMLTDDRVFAEVIAEARHIPTELLIMAYRCKGPGRFLVCSDANRGAGLAEGTPILVCGQAAVVEEGAAVLAGGGGLAGSVSPVDAMVRRLIADLGLPAHAALAAASAVPAEAMGISDRKGYLRVGYDADIILLDPALSVRRVWCRGAEAKDTELP